MAVRVRSHMRNGHRVKSYTRSGGAGTFKLRAPSRVLASAPLTSRPSHLHIPGFGGARGPTQGPPRPDILKQRIQGHRYQPMTYHDKHPPHRGTRSFQKRRKAEKAFSTAYKRHKALRDAEAYSLAMRNFTSAL